MRPPEVPRYSIVACHKRHHAYIFKHVTGHWQELHFQIQPPVWVTEGGDIVGNCSVRVRQRVMLRLPSQEGADDRPPNPGHEPPAADRGALPACVATQSDPQACNG